MIDYDRFADIYDVDMGANMGVADIPFYLRYAAARSPVLELGCGTARVMRPLVESGATVTGIDRSLKMLEKAKTKLADLDPMRYDLCCADLTRFALKRRYRLAICAFSTYSKLLRESHQHSFLELVFEHLQPKGVFLLDMFLQTSAFLELPDGAEIEDYKDRWWPERQCWISRRKRVWKDVLPRVNRIELQYTFQGKNGSLTQYTKEDFTRYSTREELHAYLEAAGFQIRDIFSNYDGKPYYEGSPRVIFDARRPK